MKTSQQNRFVALARFYAKLALGVMLLIALPLKTTIPSMAATAPPKSEQPRLNSGPTRFDSARELSDLAQRFNSLDANWGRFQLSGGLTLAAATPLNTESGNPSLPDFSQQLSLNLDAYIDRNLQFTINLSHQGGWGFSNQTLNPVAPAMIAAPRVDEAFLKLEQSRTLDYLGRFRFTLGPLGLISDFAVNPMEGLVLQYQWGDLSLTGLYSRINTVYRSNSTEISPESEDYVAARWGWSKRNMAFGLNLIPNGLLGEKSFSMDFVNNFPNSRIMGELGWYSYHSANYPQNDADWTPGIIVGYSCNPSPRSTWQFKLGYIPPRFQPSFTSLTYSSGDDREWFTFNSQGIEVTQKQCLTRSTRWENRLILLAEVAVTPANPLYYHWRSSILKDFSPVNQLEFGIDLKSSPGLTSHQALVKWNLRF